MAPPWKQNHVRLSTKFVKIFSPFLSSNLLILDLKRYHRLMTSPMNKITSVCQEKFKLIRQNILSVRITHFSIHRFCIFKFANSRLTSFHHVTALSSKKFVELVKKTIHDAFLVPEPRGSPIFIYLKMKSSYL